MRKFTLLVASIVLLAPPAGVARERQVVTFDGQGVMPMAPPGRTFKTGTGRIRGRILAADTGQPIRRVQVRLFGQDVAPKTMLTDATGRYEFAELPAGRFTVSAMKSGYVTVQYGQTRAFESGKPIELADGQLVDKADIPLPRGSVIAGRVVDEFGEPVADAMVMALRSAWSNGRRRLLPAGRGSQTNDLGQYRIFGLPPGDYYVSATYRGAEIGMVEMTGMVNVSAGPAASGYAATYYPGTTSAGEAQRVRLTLGQEATGTDFPLAPVKLARVAGMVVRSDGQPAANTMLALVPRGAENMFSMMDRGGRTDANGNFTLPGIAPGDYNLQVRGVTIGSMSTGDGNRVMITTRMEAGGGTAQEPEFASVPVTVAGEDVSGLVVVTTKGATASGRLSFEGGPQPTSLSGIRIVMNSTENEPTLMLPAGPGQGPPGGVRADGSFELRGLSGPRVVRVFGLPPGWVLKAVHVEGQDVTDTGFDFKPGGAVSGIDVVVTTRATEINGTVTTSAGNPVKDYTVVVFAADPARWALPQSRYQAMARPDQEGRFKVRNLPPGDYLAVAVEYLPQGDWNDPEVLDHLKGRAAPVTLDEGESKAIQLKIVT